MKIICSDGPRVNNTDSLLRLYKAGMNVVRFNFSHTDYNNTEHLISFAREKCPDLQILQDLQGVKLRVAQEYPFEIKVISGQEVVFCSSEVYMQARDSFEIKQLLIPVYFDGDFSSLSTARTILMKDASMEFRIEEFQSPFIKTTVSRGGVVRARKALNAPGMDRSKLDLTEKDRHDILWGLERSVDIICLSFVCSSNQIKKMKEFITKEGKGIKTNNPKIWAKIETNEGLDNFSSILRNVDGIMLGRGDLAPEIGIYEVPEVQSTLLKKMKGNTKDFIIATQVLESMTRNPFPSRPELNDIYYCLSNKVSGFMLCAETGIGRYPVMAIKTLKDMIDRYYKPK